MGGERAGIRDEASAPGRPDRLAAPAGRVYTHRLRAGAADVDARGSAHPDALARWVQEAAAADGHDSGVAPESFWIIRRTTIRVRRMPRFEEALELRTWCSGVAKSVAERSTEIRGAGGADVDVEAIWVHVDPAGRRPVRLPPDFLQAFGPPASAPRPRSSLRHPPAPPAGAERLAWSFAVADIDRAGHVSNIAYWRLAEEHLDIPREAPCLLEAEYRAGIGAGPATVHRGGSTLWVGEPGPSLAATLRVSEPGAGGRSGGAAG